MNRKNGFTLIELLATIMIISIISIIAVVTVNRYVTNSSEEEFINTVYNIFDAVEYYHTDTDEVEGNISDLDLKNKARIISEATWKIVDLEIYLCNLEDKQYKVKNTDINNCISSKNRGKIEAIRK